ncbi:MAG TPA: hypothetical protein VNK46_07430 [Nitrospiraceae bacterium]|jgi:hypothetical protein|nr:hypothetical protein [Nitrospiraceae bacterium]
MGRARAMLLRTMRERFASRWATAVEALRFAAALCRAQAVAAMRRVVSTASRGLAAWPPKPNGMRRGIAEASYGLMRWLVDRAQAMRMVRGGKTLIALRERVKAQQRELAQITAQV